MPRKSFGSKPSLLLGHRPAWWPDDAGDLVVARLKQMLGGKPHSMRLIADDGGQVSSDPCITDELLDLLNARFLRWPKFAPNFPSAIPHYESSFLPDSTVSCSSPCSDGGDVKFRRGRLRATGYPAGGRQSQRDPFPNEATGYVTTAERTINWEDLQKELPPGTPKPDDSALAPGALVFTPTSGVVPLNDLSAWWRWVHGANWRLSHGPSHSSHGSSAQPGPLLGDGCR